jgi:hypothetical protein
MKQQRKRPPWWFAPAVWAGIAGTAALMASVVTSTSQ